MNEFVKPSLIGLGLIIAVGAPLAWWSVQRDSVRTVHFANGIDVTPIEVHPNDVAQLLDVTIWKFKMVRPDAATPLFLSVGLYQNGKFAKTLTGGIGYGPWVGQETVHRSEQSQITFSVVPVGNTLFGAKQLRYRLATEGGVATGTIANPILGGHGCTLEAQFSAPDNLVYLMSTNKAKSYLSGDPEMNDTALVLSFSTKPPQ